ncbi:MAG: hypothetical protein PHQ04_06280 [Opitutaceae bacterium]|nr:hypothetical protein [Opitutaceae bacterium]
MRFSHASIVLGFVAVIGFPLRAADNQGCPSTCQTAATPATYDSAWLAKAKADYPLKTCVVSGDELVGDMGEPIDFIHKEASKPDRLVRFCCKMCVPKFKKDPAKYLAKIDEAATAAKAGEN